MQSRIYSFQIVRAVVNGVYEALDTDSNSGVMLYEWTPATPDRAAAKLRLSEIHDQMSGKAFSADASLYLVAASLEEGAGLLKTLQSHNLFTGVQSGAPSPPPPPPTRIEVPSAAAPTSTDASTLPLLPPPVAVPEKESGSVMGWIIALIISAGLAFFIGDSYGDSNASRAAARKNSDSSNYASQQLSAAQSQNDDLQNKLSKLQDQLNGFQGVHVLRITNKTPSNLHVAVRYRNWAGSWVLSGWQVIASDTTATVATSPDEFFYYTGYNDWGVVEGSDKADTYNVSKSGDFVYSPDLETLTNGEPKIMRRVQYGTITVQGR